MSSTAIIMAAGKSTRMKSNRSKVLHEVCGRTMLDYVLRTCYGAGCSRVLVVVGHAKEDVMGAFAGDDRIRWVEQTEQLGTGHAVRVCEHELKKVHGDVFILAGDGPLIRDQVLRTVHEAHRDDHAEATMATAVLDDPTGYGRVIRDASGDFVDVVEQPDCTPEQREIREVFPSIYCVKAEALLWAVSKLTNTNKKHEYYLTEIFGHLKRGGRRVLALQAVTPEDVLAVNTRQQLAEVDAIMQDRIQRSFRENGVTIVSPVNSYIEDGAAIGPDTTIHPFSFIGRDASIGRECVIGPFATVPRSSVVPERSTVMGNVHAGTRVLEGP